MGEDETAIESVPRTPSGRVCSLCHHSFDRRGARRRGRHAPDDVRGHRVKQFELAALLFPRESCRVCLSSAFRLLFAQPNGLFAIGTAGGRQTTSIS